MSKSQQVRITFAQFAHSLGASDRLTLEISQVWYEEYVSADDVTRTARREEFILNYMQGRGYSATKAAKVMAQNSRERGGEDRKVYDAARAKFAYHVVRDAKPTRQGNAQAADPVAKLLADYAKLTPGQKRSFAAKFAAL